VKSLVQNKVRKVVLFTEKKEDELQMTHLFVIACVIGTKFASEFIPTKDCVMKKSHLIAIAVIAVAIATLVSASSDVTTYANFDQASESGDKVKLVGQLVKEAPIEYNPEKDPNYLAFQLKDDAGSVRRVVLRSAKPQDFERSEQIVLTGAMNGEIFEASDMLLKCPSKYQDQEVYIRSEQG
jgi:cytochrome c-type biogenesis protein CcmE